MQRIKEHTWAASFSRAFQFLLSLMVFVADLYLLKKLNKYLILATNFICGDFKVSCLDVESVIRDEGFAFRKCFAFRERNINVTWRVVFQAL